MAGGGARRRPIRVLVAEDSLFARGVLVKVLESDPGIKVVGLARNGKEAVERVRELRPDVVTMDIRMPVMDGFEATQAIMAESPTPILVISASVGDDDLKISFNAIQAGALDIIEKPRGNLQSGYERLGAEIVRRVRLIAEIRVFRHLSPRLQRPLAWTPPPGSAERGPERAVAIGASTGGPSALLALLQAAPAGFPAPVFITQHISDGFGRGCAEWLARNSALEVKLAQDGERVRGGVVYFCPDRGVLQLRGKWEVAVRPQGDASGSATIDAMISSVADAWRERAIGVLLTGMGSDGVDGLRRVKAHGGSTVVQDEKTSVIWGMPRAAAEAGVADQVLALGQIPRALLRLVAPAGR
ncbi:MAG TPA: chemotaxis-specific protein-glutamate methyltransferase CheB [Candidatus Methanoperedens sp.]|nr:chemotaxis-specific protein-glutamate methyltransferase CheB [Candidatus Methanoperedens sp.]